MTTSSKHSALCLIIIILISTLLVSCGSDDTAKGAGIAFQLKWPGAKSVASVPTGVEKVRMSVSGPDMTTMINDFVASAGTGSIANVPAGTGRTITFQGLNASSTITHQATVTGVVLVAGQNYNCGTVPMTAMVINTVPTAPVDPSGLSATSVSSSQINLAWVDNSNDETGFKIERKNGTGGTYTQISTAAANATSYNDTGLTASTTYYYRVRASNNVGDSGYTTEANSTTSSAAAAITSSISGTITNFSSGSAAGAVMVTLSGSGSTTATTDISGNYTFSNVQNGNYTLTPSKTGFTFSPATLTAILNGANVSGKNFSATPASSSGATLTDPTTGMVFLKVTGGSYTMGDTFGDGRSDELPSHQVTLKDFYIGKYEVTQGEWQGVMGSNPSYFTACGANCPVEQVSWDDIQTFITTLNLRSGKSYRLPTEAEWEYAARSGGKNEKYSGGNDINAVAWYSSNSSNITHPVGQKQSNGLGLYDMSGNVYEWVNDWYGLYGSTAQTNPTGPYTGIARVFRGGKAGSDASVSVFCRTGYPPNIRDVGIGGIGFRLAVSIN